MNIQLNNVGKRYNYEWIFRKVNAEFSTGNNYVILGSNGSGKSTLLQTIAGNLIPSEGTISYKTENTVDAEQIYMHMSFAAPYLELFEDFTLTESIEFHQKFKPFYDELSVSDIIQLAQLEKSKNKQLKYYSSGMKQRVRLTMAVLSKTPLLLLDEPTSNLDKKAIDWYQQLVSNYSSNRLIIVASNQLEYEYPFCKQQILVEDYK